MKKIEEKIDHEQHNQPDNDIEDTLITIRLALLFDEIRPNALYGSHQR